MFVYRRTVRIAWGDCDPANIVYYPRYFEIFDQSTNELFAAAGFPKKATLQRFGMVGWPMVDTRAKFYVPSTFDDEIEIESRVAAWHRSSFEILHRVFKGEVLAVEGFETRVFVGPHPDDPKRLKSVPVPESVKARFSAAENLISGPSTD
ncbi:thioesterase family protein [Bradyrhizobium sp. WD16]|uniref:acyl-CoA thioesterase n=1 Tax=Bradyrhizobium sp. WD16 TaxID=1521768 RepID=UPI0020A2C057|nr:thioesterase family protein [Bradyrhizobium sp. WD16]UTD26393.1 acyl-CoA thioesterase [Bradyrhizobium sp. WD16]